MQSLAGGLENTNTVPACLSESLHWPASLPVYVALCKMRQFVVDCLYEKLNLSRQKY